VPQYKTSIRPQEGNVVKIKDDVVNILRNAIRRKINNFS
jgi:hypothetical protein